MNVIELIEGGGLLIVCALLIVFVAARARKANGNWPAGIITTNAMVLLIIATGFFGIAVFIASFMA